MAKIEYPNGNKSANPLVVVDRDELLEFFREKADLLGLGDRAGPTAVQINYTEDGEAKVFHCVPDKVVVMFSGIPDSRTK